MYDEFKDRAKNLLNHIILKVDNNSICKVNDDGNKYGQRHQNSLWKYKNIARGTTDPEIDSVTGVILIEF